MATIVLVVDGKAGAKTLPRLAKCLGVAMQVVAILIADSFHI